MSGALPDPAHERLAEQLAGAASQPPILSIEPYLATPH